MAAFKDNAREKGGVDCYTHMNEVHRGMYNLPEIGDENEAYDNELNELNELDEIIGVWPDELIDTDDELDEIMER
jgi:hypothetical protein